MPFVVAHDVYRGIKAAFDADAAAVELFPGGLHAERKPATELWPYGVVKVDDVEFAQDSGPLVIHVSEATVTAWKDASSAATAGDLAREIGRASCRERVSSPV